MSGMRNPTDGGRRLPRGGWRHGAHPHPQANGAPWRRIFPRVNAGELFLHRMELFLHRMEFFFHGVEPINGGGPLNKSLQMTIEEGGIRFLWA